MKFSVTIPAFKSKYLKECIESVLRQTYLNYEIIIVNDASPENIESVIHSFSNPKIKYFCNEKNIGAVEVVDNWNKCLEYATGDYIICMGDDDMLLPNCLEEYAKLIEKYPGLGVYHAWTEIIDENGDFVDLQAPRPERESVYSLIWNRWNGRKQYIGDFCFDAARLRKNGGFYKLPLAWGSDDISAVIAANYSGIANCQSIGFCYRINSQTISNTGMPEIKLKAIDEEMDWYKSFLKNEPQSELDKKIWFCINKMLQGHFDKKKSFVLTKDLCNSLSNVLYWFIHRKKYRISLKVILYALFTYLKIRNK